jgi:CRISPR/Cas system-associated protein Cas10 (large subunit of type III CRISPR-Cas system)
MFTPNIQLVVRSIRLIARHFLSLVPTTTTGKIPRRACIVCNHTRRREKKCADAHYQCDVCNVGLCTIGGFEGYYTLKHF